MKHIYKQLLWATLSSLVAIQLSAQSSGNDKVFPNRGFEEWKNGTPTGWRIGSSLFPEQVKESRPGGTGTYALKVYLNTDNIFLNKPVPVKAKKKYAFSFWYKGSINNNRMTVTLLWYDNGKVASRKDVITAITSKDKWKKAEVDVAIPENIHSMGMKLGIRSGLNESNLVLDDFAMELKGDSDPTSALEAPQNLKMKAYQGEMEVSWSKVTDNQVKWEVTFDDKVETTISENTFIKTKLTPGSRHTIRVRAVKGNVFSQYVQQTGTTERLKESESSEDRVPYLRTINPDGTFEGRFLKLYYNELANPNAKISYKLNGIAIEPKNNTLEFPDFEGFYKQFQLEIYIDEGEGREWEILYPKLGVKQNYY